MSELREAFKSLNESILQEKNIAKDSFYSIIGIVKSLDSENVYTVSPLDGGPDIKNISLFVGANDNVEGMIPAPAVNSRVIVTFIKDLAYITSLTNVSEIKVKIPKLTAVVDENISIRGGTDIYVVADEDLYLASQTHSSDGKIYLNTEGAGNYGGLVKVGKLEDTLKDIIGNINDNIDLIRTAISGLGGAYTPVALGSGVVSRDRYENKQILQ